MAWVLGSAVRLPQRVPRCEKLQIVTARQLGPTWHQQGSCCSHWPGELRVPKRTQG